MRGKWGGKFGENGGGKREGNGEKIVGVGWKM